MVKIIEKSINQKKKSGQVTFEGDKVSISLDYSLCTNCGLCISSCPHKVLAWQEKLLKNKDHRIDSVGVIDLSKCDNCKICQGSCKVEAILIE